ncbi:MAG: hypothetical protein HQK50_12360 [Oligoflexia bacterium]|nr:hypothetical protein [Oligoflexia bacterium]MBF0366359.1 hypothetical protein [Oligoflexia bacterium]
MKYLLPLITLLLFITFSTPSFAYEKQMKKFVSELDQQLKSMGEALSDDPTVSEEKLLFCPDQSFFFNSLWVRFGIDIVFAIPAPIVSIKISPQIGFIWGRNNPPGWKTYHP